MKKLILIGIILISIIACKKEEVKPEPTIGTVKAYYNYNYDYVVLKVQNVGSKIYYSYDVDIYNSDLPEFKKMAILNNIAPMEYYWYLYEKTNDSVSLYTDGMIKVNAGETITIKAKY